jgi:hypothetical protein
MAVIPHPPYSPDLAPCDFSHFQNEIEAERMWFDSIEEIQVKLQRVLDTLTEKDFHEVFQKCRKQWDQCLHAGGNYFKGDGGQ